MLPVSTPSRPPVFAWVLLAVLVAWVGVNGVALAKRIVRVTELPEWSVDAPVPDAASPTGYRHGWRRLILPEHNDASYHWIVHAQALLTGGQWRMRHLAHENAPLGRESHLSSPYAWWLAGLAWLDHALTGRPRGLCVERAVLYADPLLQLVVVGLGFGLAWRLSGATAATVAACGMLAWFPLSGNFVPGAPDKAGLLLAVNLLAGLLLASVLRQEPESPQADQRSIRRRFAWAGLLQGFGLWLDAVPQAAIILGYGAGGLLFNWSMRRRGEAACFPAPEAWRWWGLSGVLAAMLGYLVEYAPGGFDLRPAANHPLHGLAWIGLVEIIAVLGSPARGWRGGVRLAMGAVAMLGLPVALAAGEGPMPWQLKADAARLSVAAAVNAEHAGAWLRQEGLSLPVAATLLPLGLVVGAVIRRRSVGAWVVLAGPCLLTAVLAAWQLSWWSSCQVCLLALLVAVLPRLPAKGWLWCGAAACAGLPGLLLLSPPRTGASTLALSESELAGLIERDLGHWLSQRKSAGVILAPPSATAALHFYAGLPGLGTFAWENRAGLTAAARIASASSPDEAAELMNARNVTHIVMPSWDNFLDEYAGLGRAARIGAPVAVNSFVAALHRWEPPLWLRPLAYPIPLIEGLEGQAVEVFEMTDPQDAPTAMSRMAEYFLETGRLDHAEMTRRSLAGFPAHVGALAAGAKVEAALGRSAAFNETVELILPLLEAMADRNLAWDRRVTLAVVLFSAKQAEPARQQLRRCLREVTLNRLQLLGPQSHLQLHLLARRLGEAFPSREIEEQSLSLLPPQTRARLQ